MKIIELNIGLSSKTQGELNANSVLNACGAFRISPGQWVIIGGNKARFVRVSANGDLWVAYG